MATRPHFQRLVERVRLLPPLPAAFVYPCDRDSIQLALSGAFAGYLAPVLVGPEARIRDLAGRSGLDISRLPIVDTADTAEGRDRARHPAGARRQGHRPREGQHERRRPARPRRGRRVGAAHGPTPVARLFRRPARAAERHAARRRSAQHRAESRREEGHRRQHDRPRTHAWSRRSGGRAARRAGPAIGRLSLHDRRRRAEIDGRPGSFRPRPCRGPPDRRQRALGRGRARQRRPVRDRR